jgi:carbon monoxide dehydrogenase subunit G
MKSTTIRHPIDAPPGRLWEALIDLEHAAEHISCITRIEMLTPDPIGVGTRWRESRLVMKKEQAAEFEIVEFSPPESYTARSESCGIEMLFKISVHAAEDQRGSLAEMTFSTRPLTTGAKIMQALTGWMMAGMCRKAFVKDMEDLGKWIRAQSSTPKV